MPENGRFLLPSSISSRDTNVPRELSEEQEMIRDMVRGFVRDRVLKHADAIEHPPPGDFSLTRSLLREAGELGLLGLELPERYGGMGLDTETATLVIEEFGRVGSFATSYGAHTGIGTMPILYYGSEACRWLYLPRLATGEFIAAYALTEAGSGSDANAARTTAVRVGDSYVLNGEKAFVTNGGFADVFIVFAQCIDPDAPLPDKERLTAFVVERDQVGVSTGPEEHKMGLHGSSTTPLILQDVRVPLVNVLGEPGQGFRIATTILNIGRFKLGALALGAARQCLADALAYAQQRIQFKEPLIEFGLIQAKLAGMDARVSAMEAVVYRTAALLGDLEDPGNNQHLSAEALAGVAVECSAVKVFCSEALSWIVDENVQLHGGYGYTEEYAAARFYRDARINRIFEGTNEVNRLLLLRELGKRVKAGTLDLRGAIGRIRKGIPRMLATAALRPWHSATHEPWRAHRAVQDTKRAVLLAIGASLKARGRNLDDHQVLVAAMSDCIIAVYVLDSLLACEEYQADLALLFTEMVPGLRARIHELLADALRGRQLDFAATAVGQLMPEYGMRSEAFIKYIVDDLRGFAGFPQKT